MSVSNGQNADETTFNAAFMSRTVDTSTVGKVDLSDPAAVSGTAITNVQKNLNAQGSFSGAGVNGAKDQLPTWVDNSIGTASDTLKDRAEALTTATFARIIGPGVATDNALVRFDGTSGTLAQNSTSTLSDTGELILGDGDIRGGTAAGHDLEIESTTNATKGDVLLNPSGGPVGVGVLTVNASAIFEISSTIGGFLFPRMTTVQRDAIAAPATGLTIDNTTDNEVQRFNGTSWVSIAGGALLASNNLSDVNDIPDSFDNLFANASATIANNQAVAADVTGWTLDSAVFSSAIYFIEIDRPATTDIMSNGTVMLQRVNAAWRIINHSFAGDISAAAPAGVTLTVTETAGVAQVQYTSTNETGGTSGTLQFKRLGFQV